MTSRPGYFAEAQVPDMERRVSDMVSIGVVAEQDYSNPKAPRVRVKVGKNLTGWIAWSSGSAGGNTDWQPLDKGEQVIMAAPSGDLGQAVILGTIHQNDAEAPDHDPDVTARKWKDGSLQSYNRAKHEWLLKLNPAGKFTVEVGETLLVMKDGDVDLKTKKVTITAPGGITCNTPKLTVPNGDVIASGVSLLEHLHTKVMPGPLLSGPPLGGAGGLSIGGIGGGSGGISDGGGIGGGESDHNTPSSPGNPETAGTYGNGIARDATGIYRGAIQTRVPYQGQPNIEGSGIVEMNFGYPFRGVPAQPDKIDAATFYERVRPSTVGVFDGGVMQILVSESKDNGATWTDDVMRTSVWDGGKYVGTKAGVYTGPIPDGIQSFAQEGPFDVFVSESGAHYAKYCDWFYQYRMVGANASAFGTRPIFWKLTPEEVDEFLVPEAEA